MSTQPSPRRLSLAITAAVASTTLAIGITVAALLGWFAPAPGAADPEPPTSASAFETAAPEAAAPADPEAAAPAAPGAQPLAPQIIYVPITPAAAQPDPAARPDPTLPAGDEAAPILPPPDEVTLAMHREDDEYDADDDDEYEDHDHHDKHRHHDDEDDEDDDD